MKECLEDAISHYIVKYGEESLLQLIHHEGELLENENFELTIIVNDGIHPLQACHKRGEVFVASSGNLDFSSSDNATLEINRILVSVAKKLQSKSWRKVYVVPFGPSVLSMCIKSLVYRVLNQETIDVLHAGDGRHYDINVDLREIAVAASESVKKSNSTFQGGR